MRPVFGRLFVVGLGALFLVVGWTQRSRVRISLSLPSIEQIELALISRQRETLAGIASDRIMVALVTGQSNAGNYGPRDSFSPQPRVLDFFSGALSRAKDPMPGSDGLGSSPWIPLGTMVVARGRYSAVVFAVVVRGGTSVREWIPGKGMERLVARTVTELRGAGLVPTHVLWQQGETDAANGDLSPGSYKAAFQTFLASLRASKVAAPVYVALATRTAGRGASPAIRSEQQSLVNPAGKVFAGPDVDALGNEYRSDGTHFNRAGLERLATLWYETLIH